VPSITSILPIDGTGGEGALVHAHRRGVVARPALICFGFFFGLPWWRGEVEAG
jgi:hypothetical protein